MNKIMYSLLLFVLFSSSVTGGNKIQPIKYLAYFNVYNATCITYINNVRGFASFRERGPVASGVNITPFLVNGKNTVAMDVASLGALDGENHLAPDARCELRVTAVTPEDEIEVIKLVATTNDKLQPISTASFSDSEKTNGSPVVSEKVKDILLTNISVEFAKMFSREFNIQGIPDWAWTKATPFEPTAENIAKLQQAYMELTQLILNKDGAGIQKIAHISFSEKEMAEGLKPESWYKSFGFDEYLPRVSVVDPFK
ncbi:hypothetical protein ACILPN_18195 [Yersinia wautersii]|uniref:Uncharacterized protein n=1 Tax=Yersinia pseudotuberculosis TaxID=633 RepID=A0A380QA52_YERPU|nr:hypothetical protein [Yersinia pseudotuberculosis]SUP83969.1 Uncharacterised protein [Yersinia pseudotuberculosis]